MNITCDHLFNLMASKLQVVRFPNTNADSKNVTLIPNRPSDQKIAVLLVFFAY
jgi:hypothetical protein